MARQCIIMHGNLTSGYTAIGPFELEIDALKWAEKRFGKDEPDWQCIEIETTEDWS